MTHDNEAMQPSNTTTLGSGNPDSGPLNQAYPTYELARFVTGATWNVDGGYAFLSLHAAHLSGLRLGHHDIQLAPVDLGRLDEGGSFQQFPCGLPCPLAGG
jgi:hypothetical protein